MGNIFINGISRYFQPLGLEIIVELVQAHKRRDIGEAEFNQAFEEKGIGNAEPFDDIPVDDKINVLLQGFGKYSLIAIYQLGEAASGQIVGKGVLNQGPGLRGAAFRLNSLESQEFTKRKREHLVA